VCARARACIQQSTTAARARYVVAMRPEMKIVGIELDSSVGIADETISSCAIRCPDDCRTVFVSVIMRLGAQMTGGML
jgi:hypothetical protein